MDDVLNKNINADNAELLNSGSLIFNDKNIPDKSIKNKISPVDNKKSEKINLKTAKSKTVEKTVPEKPSLEDDKYPVETKHSKKEKKKITSLLTQVIPNPIWLSVSEAAKIGGVQNKTIRRAIQAKTLKYKVVSNRYLVDLVSVIIYLHTKTKLKNKLNEFGIGQYIKEWEE